MPNIERNRTPTGDPGEYEMIVVEVYAVTPEGEQGDLYGIYDSDQIADPETDLPEEYIAVELFTYYVREV